MCVSTLDNGTIVEDTVNALRVKQQRRRMRAGVREALFPALF